MVAEHGFFYLHKYNKPSNAEWKPLSQDPNVDWKQTIKPIFQYFTDRTPGSYFEEKEISLTWHYRATERKFGAFRAKELQSHLVKCTLPVNVVNVNKTIEVRPYECNSNTILRKIMSKYPDYDMVQYIGEPVNLEVEDMSKKIYTCGVGAKNQMYYLQNPEEVVTLLEKLSVSK